MKTIILGIVLVLFMNSTYMVYAQHTPLDSVKNKTEVLIKKVDSLGLEVKKVLEHYTAPEKYFGTASIEFELTVPTNYKGERSILIAGKTYIVKFFPIIEKVTTEDCLEFLSKQHAVLAGLEGARLVYKLKADQFPENKWTVSYDERDIGQDNVRPRRTPRVCAYWDGDFIFRPIHSKYDLDTDDYLLCFIEKK